MIIRKSFMILLLFYSVYWVSMANASTVSLFYDMVAACDDTVPAYDDYQEASGSFDPPELLHRVEVNGAFSEVRRIGNALDGYDVEIRGWSWSALVGGAGILSSDASSTLRIVPDDPVHIHLYFNYTIHGLSDGHGEVGEGRVLVQGDDYTFEHSLYVSYHDEYSHSVTETGVFDQAIYLSNPLDITAWSHSSTYSGYANGSATITDLTIELSAIPIPGAIWLLGTGLIGIVGIRRKFKK
jgi:hypothetical protein